MLLIGGILLGFEGQNRQGLPLRIRRKLESALVKATQLALDDLKSRAVDRVDACCIVMVLNYTFELLSDLERSRLDYDRLLPVMVRATYFSPEGLEGGYFLGTIDEDIVETPGRQFEWPNSSATFDRVDAISHSPLMSSLGPLSRLVAHAVESAHDPVLVSQTMDALADFSRSLMVQWRQNRLSQFDVAEEKDFLDAESLKSTIPVMWRVLRNSFYSVVIVLRAVLGRVINDPVLAADRRECTSRGEFHTVCQSTLTYPTSGAPFLSMKALHILRNLYFISVRIGQSASSQYTFALLAAVDILTQYPDLAESVLRGIKPTELGQIPTHPLERCLDLFFLNVAEHFTLVLSPSSSEELLISSAAPYLAAGGSSQLLQMFEAAHSVVLAVFAIPANAGMTAKHLPFYADTLFNVCTSCPAHIDMNLSPINLVEYPGLPPKPLRAPIPPRL